MHPACGTHFNHALDQSVVRLVEHESFVCEDCAAIEVTRSKFHTQKAHKADNDANCPDCRNEVFYVSERVPIDEYERR